MPYQKRVKTLSFESLHQLIDQAHQEINRRQAFIQHIPSFQLRDIPFSVRARDLLYRTIVEKKKLVYWQDAEKLMLCETLKLLALDDWMQIRYKNAKVFDEIRLTFHAYQAPFERYYGKIDADV